jgi:hypothetical protein
MQGKGAGPVNRVELESQVLCAALRQSFHLRDKIGAFTSVRELSHLFPDLLPPPEKDDDEANSNKANYYAVLSMKPQSAANAVISSYLRTVRKFLKNYTAKDNRQEYNRILNAGFILRKPRLRLSHDLVVSRRWLHEESRLALMAQQEVTVDQTAAVKAMQAMLAAERGTTQSSPSPRVPIDPTDTPTVPMPVVAPASSAPPPVPITPLSPKLPPVKSNPPAAAPPPVPTAAKAAPALPPLPQADAPSATPGQDHAAPPLPPVIAAAMQDGSNELRFEAKNSDAKGVVPPVPPLPAKFYDPSAYGAGDPPSAANQITEALPQVVPQSVHAGQSAAASPEHAVPPVPPLPVQSESGAAGTSSPPPIPPLPVPSEPAATPVDKNVSAPPPVVAEETRKPATPKSPGFAPPLPAPSPPVAPASSAGAPKSDAFGHPQPEQPQAPVGNGDSANYPTSPAPQTTAHPIAAAAAAAAADGLRAPGRISREAAFVFDESTLRKPESAVRAQIPVVIQLLEAAQIIGPLEVQALSAQMEFAPNVPVERLILNAGYVTQQELASIKLGESLLQQGRITLAQFQVAIYDERMSGLRMAESLQVRGWLSVEVRNAIDEWHRKRS